MALSDVLAGFSEAAYQHNQNLLQMQYAQNKQVGDLLGKMAENPNLHPEQQSALFQEALKAYGTPYGKQYKGAFDPKTNTVALPVNVMTGGVHGGGLEQPQTQPGPSSTQIQGEFGPQSVALAPSQQPQAAAPTPPTTPNTEVRNATQPMSFDEQLEHQRRELQMKFETEQAPLERLKLSKPQPTGIKYIEQGTDGNAYQVSQMRYLDPESGRWQIVNQRGDTPVRKFAPRASGEMNIEDAIKLQSEDPSYTFKDEATGNPLDLQKIQQAMPDATLRHTGSGQYQVNSQRYHMLPVGNMQTPIPTVGMPTSQNVGAPLGPARVGSSMESINLPPGVNGAGNIVAGQSANVRTVPTPGVTGGPAAPVSPPQPNATTTPQNAPTAPPVKSPASPKPSLSNAPPRMPASVRQNDRSIAMPVREVAASLTGDPAHPGMPTLEDLGHFAVDPQDRNDIGTAVDMMLDSAAHNNEGGADVGFLSKMPLVGDAAQIIRNWGVRQKVTESDVQALQRVLDDPRKNAAVHQIIAAYGVIPGLRVATKGSAYQFYVKNLELELPTFKNLASGGEYYLKLSALMRDVNNATKNVNESLMPAAEKQRYEDAETRLTKLSKLSDQELKTVDVDGPHVRYLKGGVGPAVEVDENNTPIPPQRKP